MTNKIQISGKVGQSIVVISGDTPEEFLSNCKIILGESSTDDVINLFAQALDAGTAELAQATTNLIDGGISGLSPTPPAVVAAVQANAWNAPETVAPAAVPASPSEGPKEETDKFGRQYTYGIPGSPACPHGARVQMKATSKAGKPYVAWVCPTHTPSAFRQKVVKDPNCTMEFAAR